MGLFLIQLLLSGAHFLQIALLTANIYTFPCLAVCFCFVLLSFWEGHASGLSQDASFLSGQTPD